MSLKKYREELGFTQQELAGFLKISRTQLVKAEKYHRSMPYKTISTTIKIDQCLMDKGALEQLVAGTKQQHWQLQVPNWATKQANKLGHTIGVMERKLANMEKQYQQYVAALANVCKLQQMPNLTEGQTISLNLAEARIRVRCHSCGPGPQAALSIKLKAAVFMQAELAQYLALIPNS
jgi:DNA-binding XRE family transcriptional regulator